MIWDGLHTQWWWNPLLGCEFPPIDPDLDLELDMTDAETLRAAARIMMQRLPARAGAVTAVLGSNAANHAST